MDEQFPDLMAENALEFHNSVRMSANNFEIVLKIADMQKNTKFERQFQQKFIWRSL